MTITRERAIEIATADDLLGSRMSYAPYGLTDQKWQQEQDAAAAFAMAFTARFAPFGYSPDAHRGAMREFVGECRNVALMGAPSDLVEAVVAEIATHTNAMIESCGAEAWLAYAAKSARSSF